MEFNKNIVVLGCGFAGLEVVKQLRKFLGNSVDITVVDKKDHFTYNPLLFSYFAGHTKESDVILRYNDLFKGLNINFLQDKVTSIKSKIKTVNLENTTLRYDYLVVALGAEVKYNHLPRVDNKLFLFNSLNSIKVLDNHIKGIFESLKKEKKLGIHKKKLTFVVVGGGLTGVEMIGALKDKLNSLCKKYGISKKHIDITLIEGDVILSQIEEPVRHQVQNYLEKLGVNIIVGQKVTRVDSHRIYIEDGRSFASDTLIWCGGVIPTKAIFKSDLKARTDGGLIVNEYLQSITYKNIYALGDNVHFIHEKNNLKKMYIHATDKAKYVALNLIHDLTGNGEKIKYTPKKDKFWFKLGKWNGIYCDNEVFFDGFLVGLGKSLKDHYNVYKIKNELKKTR